MIQRNRLLLFCLSLIVLFMAIGYASINNITLSLAGTGNVDVDENVHITVATSAHSNSTINSFSGTMLNSTVNLANNNTETFTITVYNNTNDDYMFDQVLRDTEQSLFYDNQNITFTLNGLNRYDTLAHGQSKTFTITFGYVNGFTPSSSSDRVLNSYINFKFKKGYTVTYSNITTQNNSDYPTVAFENDSMVATFSSDVPYDVKVTMGNSVLVENTDYTYVADQNNNSNMVLTVNSVTNNITIERYYQIVYNLNGGTNNANNPDKYLHGSSESISAATKTNSTFSGWYDNAGFTGNAITSTSGKTGTLTLYAKWSAGTELATTFITGLTNGASTNSTNIITETAPDGATCTYTFAYDGTSDNYLRYIGADPCNYVKFNCDSSGNCETWRIIGVMNGVDSSSVLKIVKNDNTLSRAWNSKNNNTWVDSGMQTYLNNDYLATFNSGVINDYVLNAQWPIGAIAYNGTVSTAYTAAAGTLSSAMSIGLMSATDYYYATSGTNDSTRNTCLTSSMSGNSITSTCYNNDYLFISGQNQWTIDKSSQGNSVVYISNSGKAVRGNATSSYRYRPVVYLKSNVRIKTDGEGTTSKPFELVAGN